MALSPKLELKQGQGLVMTPQLQQAIKLLQLSHLDLNAYVEAELERNPLLERPEEDGDPVERRESAPANATGGDETDKDGERPALTMKAGEKHDDAPLDTNFENEFPDDTPQRDRAGAESFQDNNWASMGPGSGGRFDGGDYDAESLLTREPTLHEHLGEQMMLAIADPAQRMICRHLIDLVDESGYLHADLSTLGERLGVPADEIETLIKQMQGFEPAGVFARNLAECLAIQLREKNRFDPAMETLLDNVELLAKRDLTTLKTLCGVDDEDLRDMIDEIRELNPKPGSSFGSVMVQPMVPDIYVRPRPDGGWHVELNSETLPRVLVNQDYYANVSATARSEKEQTYIADCMQTANWLIKSLDQRAKTILKVGTEIVRQQDSFLAYGVQQLKPMTLRMVADAISMHESTVSRVTSNKFIATPRGIFELKYFFTSAISGAGDGEAHSAEAVRHRIKDMINAETAADVLSDDQIVRVLKAEGIDIARRTVAKYRESLRIPSSVQRRREKRTAL